MNSNPSQTRKPQISAIIPVYNEATNVGAVLEVLRETDILEEIILVNDGSSDNTADILHQAAERDPRIRVIQHTENQGKGQAIFNGWAATSAPFLVLLDADLKNLKPYHIRALITPVLEHHTDMTLGLFSGGHLHTDLSHRLGPFLTGQRGMRSEIMKYVSREAAAGYGFEVALTIATQQRGYRKRVVLMKGVWHPSSELRSERGVLEGLHWRMRMYGQIIHAWYIATRARYPNVRALFPKP